MFDLKHISSKSSIIHIWYIFDETKSYKTCDIILFNTELCTSYIYTYIGTWYIYVWCQPLGKSYISIKNPPVQLLMCMFIIVIFKLCLKITPWKKNLGLLAILCACMAQFSTNKNRQFFLFLRNGRYQTRQLMRFDHIFWSENRDIWW